MFVERVHMLPLHRIMSTNFTIADAHIHMINTHFWMPMEWPVALVCSFIHSFTSHFFFFVAFKSVSCIAFALYDDSQPQKYIMPYIPRMTVPVRLMVYDIY